MHRSICSASVMMSFEYSVVEHMKLQFRPNAFEVEELQSSEGSMKRTRMKIAVLKISRPVYDDFRKRLVEHFDISGGNFLAACLIAEWANAAQAHLSLIAKPL